MKRVGLCNAAGFGMMEVMISLLIIMVGTLGMAGLVARSATSQMDTMQRAQAIVLAKNMVARINANPANAAGYVTGGTFYGTDTTQDCSDPPALPNAAADLCEWNNLLLGATVEGPPVGGVIPKIGAMLGARGCVYQVVAGSEYMVAVAWEGYSTTVDPEDTYACGDGAYTAGRHRLILLPVTITNFTTLTPL